VKVVVTGASGFLGGALVSAFLARGDNVTAVVHRPPRSGMPVPWHRGALGEVLPEIALAGVELLVHGAHDMRPGSRRRNVEGTQLWYEQADRAGAVSQVFISSLSAHPASPSEYGRTKHEVESLLMPRGGAVVRPGLVVGGGGLFGALVQLVRRLPVLPVPGGRTVRVFLTALDDLVEVITRRRALSRRSALNVFGDVPVSIVDLVEGLRRHLGARGISLPIPAALSRLSLGLAAPLNPALRQYHESFLALEASQAYGWASCSAELGLRLKTLPEMLREAFPTVAR